MATRRAVKSTSSRAAKPSTPPRPASSATKRTVKRAAPVAAPVEADEEAPSDLNSKFTPQIDRRIIEGMLGDCDALMAEMSLLGINKNAVLRRAAELGLSEALIRQVRGVAADLAGERPGRKSTPTSLGARTCLCCDRVFLSTGPANRLCMRCRGGDAGLAAL